MHAILSDNRLSEGARIIGLWLTSQEPDADGWVELRFDAVRAILYGFPGDDAIRRHLRMLRGSGWAERKPGGKARGDLYRILDYAPEHTLKDRLGLSHTLKPDRLGLEPSLSPRSSSKEKAVVEPPISPLPISDAATKALDQHDNLLSGCRGALADYLTASVPPPKQQPYIQSLATYLNGFGFQWRNAEGATIPKDQRTGIIAAALNELGSQDETSMKNPVGDIRNLRTKLGILARDYGRTNGRHDGGGTASEGGSQAQGRRTGTDDYDHLGG
jgi:hypothetical protein